MGGPEPAKLHLLRGGRTASDEPTPPPVVELPECPDDVSDDVRRIWDYTLPRLAAAGLATPTIRDALRCYCESVITHRKASALLARSPVMLPGTVKGSIVQNPAVRVQRDAATAVRTFAQELGLMPPAVTALPAAPMPLAGTLPHLYE